MRLKCSVNQLSLVSLVKHCSSTGSIWKYLAHIFLHTRGTITLGAGVAWRGGCAVGARWAWGTYGGRAVHSSLD